MQNSESGNPRRRADSTAPDPTDVAFGRRICQGQFLAYDTIWIMVASMLAVFNFEKAYDNNGEVIIPREAFTSGFVV